MVRQSIHQDQSKASNALCIKGHVLTLSKLPIIKGTILSGVLLIQGSSGIEAVLLKIQGVILSIHSRNMLCIII